MDEPEDVDMDLPFEEENASERNHDERNDSSSEENALHSEEEDEEEVDPMEVSSEEDNALQSDYEEMNASSEAENPVESDEEEVDVSLEENVSENEEEEIGPLLPDEDEEMEEIEGERNENVEADLPAIQAERQVRNAIAIGAHGPLFQGFLDNARMNVYLQGRNNVAASDHLLVALAHNIAERETYKSLLGNLRWIKSCFVHCDIPTTIKQLWNVMGRDISNLVYSVYCSLCKTKVGDGKTATRVCNCGSCGPGLNTKHLATYIMVPIVPQIQEILKTPNIAQSLRYRDERVKINDENLEDIYDGQRYIEERTNGFLRDERNLSLSLWVDGVSLTKSSNASCCPILLHINELPPYARIKHTILGGVYVGNKKPNINSLLLLLAQHLQYLYFTGVRWRPNPEAEIISRFILLIFAADSVARPDVMRMMQYNSHYGCPKCYAYGLWINRKMVYPDEARVLRTNQQIRDDMELAVLRREIVRGVRGCSALAIIRTFDFRFGVTHDDLHNIDLGCTKQLMDLYLNDANTQWYIGDAANLRQIDEKLATIKVPTELSRRPRSITTCSKWKASEWRNWLLYYSLYCLEGILDEPYYTHFSLLCQAVFILSNASISQNDLIVARALLLQFGSLAQRHYGVQNMSFNFHFAGHSDESVAEWEPMWVYSTYPFETLCSKIKDTVTSANSRAEQIVNRFFMKKFVEQSIHKDDVSETTKNEVKKLLNYKPVDIPEGMRPGHYFIGKRMRQPRILNQFERNAILDSEEEIEEETVVNMYTTASIHGVEYQVEDGQERDYCNSIVYTKRGFFVITRLLSYQIRERTVSGILRNHLEEISNLYGTNYIMQVTRNACLLEFVSFHDVIVPAIFFGSNNKFIAIPLSNATSID